MFCGLMSISSRSWPTVDENRTSLHCQFKFKRGNQCKTLNIVDGYKLHSFHRKSMYLHLDIIIFVNISARKSLSNKLSRNWDFIGETNTFFFILPPFKRLTSFLTVIIISKLWCMLLHSQHINKYCKDNYLTSIIKNLAVIKLLIYIKDGSGLFDDFIWNGAIQRK